MSERGVEVDHSNICRWVQKVTTAVGVILSERQGEPGSQELADGRDAYQDQGSVEVSLSRRRQERPDHRRPAHRLSRQEGRSALFQDSRPATRSTGQGHDR